VFGGGSGRKKVGANFKGTHKHAHIYTHSIYTQTHTHAHTFTRTHAHTLSLSHTHSIYTNTHVHTHIHAHTHTHIFLVEYRSPLQKDILNMFATHVKMKGYPFVVYTFATNVETEWW